MIGLFGGTFDPVHFGHLRPALEVLQGLPLDQVRFMPLHQPVHRAEPQAPAALRLAMLRAAIAGQAGFQVDERELERRGNSYTYDSLCSLRAELGEQVPICLLLGADTFRGFLAWHRPAEILQLAHLVVMDRPGTAALPEALDRWAAPHRCDHQESLREAPAGRILFWNVTPLAISSTQIRRWVARGGSPRFLVPDAVAALIERERLYRHDGN